MTLLNYTAEIHVRYTQQRLHELRHPAGAAELRAAPRSGRPAGLRVRLGTALIALGDVIAGPRTATVEPSATVGRSAGQLQLR